MYTYHLHTCFSPPHYVTPCASEVSAIFKCKNRRSRMHECTLVEKTDRISMSHVRSYIAEYICIPDYGRGSVSIGGIS